MKFITKFTLPLIIVSQILFSILYFLGQINLILYLIFAFSSVFIITNIANVYLGQVCGLLFCDLEAEEYIYKLEELKKYNLLQGMQILLNLYLSSGYIALGKYNNATEVLHKISGKINIKKNLGAKCVCLSNLYTAYRFLGEEKELINIVEEIESLGEHVTDKSQWVEKDLKRIFSYKKLDLDILLAKGEDLEINEKYEKLLIELLENPKNKYEEITLKFHLGKFYYEYTNKKEKAGELFEYIYNYGKDLKIVEYATQYIEG